MSQQPEAKLKLKVKKILDAAKVYYQITTDSLHRGLPDVQGCWHGSFFALELKVDAPESKQQTLELQRMTRVVPGGFAGVLRVNNTGVWFKNYYYDGSSVNLSFDSVETFFIFLDGKLKLK